MNTGTRMSSDAMNNGVQIGPSAETPRVMEFLSAPQITPGLNFTLRYGPKWYAVAPGTPLLLRKSGTEKTVQTATVVWSAPTSWKIFPAAWLPFNQAPEARTMEGLEKAMDAAYGPQWKDPLTALPLVAVFFWAHPAGVL
jgi:hypothetical protein